MTKNQTNIITSSIREYCRHQSNKNIIPSITDIHCFLRDTLHVPENEYKDDEKNFMTLKYRIYIITYMLRYNMPLQRKNLPGKRHMSEICQTCGFGWYAQLSEDEKYSLNDPCLTLSSVPLSEDSDYGQCRNELYQNKISCVALNDQINSDMFRNPEENSCAFIKYIQGKSYPGQNNPMNTPKFREIDQSKVNLMVSKKLHQNYLFPFP